MTPYLFILGRTPALARREVLSFFPNTELLDEHIVRVEGDIDVIHWINTLGGTVKIAEVVGEEISPSAETLSSYLLASNHRHSISFGLSVFGKNNFPKDIRAQVKSALERLGIAARYVVSRNTSDLSSVVVQKQGLLELILVWTGTSYSIACTKAVQPFEQWSNRDYGRPYADPKAGMLPPKVARMVVNLARRFLPSTMNDEPRTLLDPFCGMGTILGEALLGKWSVIGLDQSHEAIRKAKANLEWLIKQNQGLSGSMVQLLSADATRVSEKISRNSIDAVVTEPYMGTTKVSEKRQLRSLWKIKSIQNLIKGLDKLYIGCLREWHTILKVGGVVVIAMPSFRIGDEELFVKTVVDRCENLGYTLLDGPIEYSRPQAVVRRNFYVLRKN